MKAAVRAALELYEAEILSFLRVRLGSEFDADEVFGQLSEDLWRGVPNFRWQCAFRTWFYSLARHAADRFLRSPANRSSRRLGLSHAPESAARDRSRTRPYLRTDVKDRFAALRAALSPEEQLLLVLRIDREMSWEEVAQVLHAGGDGVIDPATLRRQTTNLRQRFRTLKERLRELSRAEGLLDEEGG